MKSFKLKTMLMTVVLTGATMLAACNPVNTTSSSTVPPTSDTSEVKPSFEIVSNLNLKKGYTSQLTPTNVVGIEVFSYLSEDDSVATVSDTGLVTAIAEGVTNIIVEGNGVIKNVLITVETNTINGLDVLKLNNIATFEEETMNIDDPANDALNFGWGKEVSSEALAAKIDFANVQPDTAKVVRTYSDTEKYSLVENGVFTPVLIAGADTTLTEETMPEGVHASLYFKTIIPQKADGLRVWGMSWQDDVVSGMGSFRVTAYTQNEDKLSYTQTILQPIDIGALTQDENGYIDFNGADATGQITDAPMFNMFIFKPFSEEYDLRGEEIVLAVEFRAIANQLGAEGANKQSRFGVKRLGCTLEPDPDFTITSPTTLEMAKNDEVQITYDVIGAVNPENFTFESSNNSVASVSNTGLIKAVGSGNATITVKNGDIEKTIDVVVKNSVFTVPSNIKLVVNDTYQINPTNVENVDSFEYSTSKENVATVSDTGLIKAIASGSTIITVKGGDLTKTIEVTVTFTELYGKDATYFNSLKSFTAEEVDIESKGANAINFVPGWGATGANASKVSLDNSAPVDQAIVRGYTSTENHSLINVEENWMDMITCIGGLPTDASNPHAALFFATEVPNKANFRVWTYGGAPGDVVSGRGKFRVVFYTINEETNEFSQTTLVNNFQEMSSFAISVDEEGWISYENSLDGFLAFTVPQELKGKKVIASIEVEGRSDDGKQDRFAVKRMGFCN